MSEKILDNTALAAEQPAPESVKYHEWRPIEMAPKDGTRVLLYPHYMTAHWEFGDDEWMLTEIPLEPDGTIAVDWSAPPKRWYCLYANVAGCEPTRWMSLPEPPTDK